MDHLPQTFTKYSDSLQNNQKEKNNSLIIQILAKNRTRTKGKKEKRNCFLILEPSNKGSKQFLTAGYNRAQHAGDTFYIGTELKLRQEGLCR